MFKQRYWHLLAVLGLCAGTGCNNCCDDRWGVTYGLVYGTVRSSTQAPVADALVGTYDNYVRSDSLGHFRLPLTIRAAFGPGTWGIRFQASRTDSAGHVLASDSSSALVTLVAHSPVTDSTRMDIQVAWSP